MNARIADLVEEAFATTQMSSSDAKELKAQLIAAYETEAQFFEDEASANQYIYGNRLREHHDVYRLGDTCFVIPAQIDIRRVIRPYTRKIAHEYSGQPDLIPEKIDAVKTTIAALKETLHKHHLSRRKYTQEGKEPPVYPPDGELRRFYECERKTQYSTQEIAESRVELGNSAYQCKWCQNWHQGRPPTGEYVPYDMRVHRWQQAWRRHHGV